MIIGLAILVIVAFTIAAVTTDEIVEIQELPASCDGVVSTDERLFPSAEECMEDLAQEIYEYCYAELKDEISAQLCTEEAIMKIYENCEGSDDLGMLSVSEEVCVMSSMQDAYRNLISEN